MRSRALTRRWKLQVCNGAKPLFSNHVPNSRLDNYIKLALSSLGRLVTKGVEASVQLLELSIDSSASSCAISGSLDNAIIVPYVLLHYRRLMSKSLAQTVFVECLSRTECKADLSSHAVFSPSNLKRYNWPIANESQLRTGCKKSQRNIVTMHQRLSSSTLRLSRRAQLILFRQQYRCCRAVSFGDDPEFRAVLEVVGRQETGATPESVVTYVQTIP